MELAAVIFKEPSTLCSSHVIQKKETRWLHAPGPAGRVKDHLTLGQKIIHSPHQTLCMSIPQEHKGKETDRKREMQEIELIIRTHCYLYPTSHSCKIGPLNGWKSKWVCEGPQPVKWHTVYIRTRLWRVSQMIFWSIKGQLEIFALTTACAWAHIENTGWKW